MVTKPASSYADGQIDRALIQSVTYEDASTRSYAYDPLNRSKSATETPSM